MSYTTTDYCSVCDDETEHHVEVEELPDINDDDLSSVDYIKAANGDPIHTLSCQKCGNTYDTM